MSAIYATMNNWLILGLTPVERWQAARRFDSNFFTVQQWMVIVAVIALVIFVAAIVFIGYKRKAERSGEHRDHFLEQAAKRGLSNTEIQVLHYVAKLVRLKNHSTIFTMKKAFELGAATLVRQAPAGGMSSDRVEQLAKELNFLREKLGFKKSFGSSAGVAASSRKPSTREIPEGKTLYITRRTNRDVDDIEVIVISNEDKGITVKLPNEVNSPRHEQWRARYFYGASVWEFDVSVIKNNGDTLVLGHSEDIRFINRRRFFRVPVNRNAYIAQFPFEKQIFSDSASATLQQADPFESRGALPKFAPAVLTELAGPGLKLETALELKFGQQVAVVFDVESQREHNSHNEQSADRPAARIVEGIGEVRHCSTIENGFSVAVELTSLSDANINELIRATNVAAVEAGAEEEQDEGVQVTADTAASMTV